MTILLDNVSADIIGSFVAGNGSERQILVTGDFDTGAVTFELSRTVPVPPGPIAVATDLTGVPLSIDANRAVNIGPIPVGMQIRARLDGAGGSASNVRADIF